MSQPFFVRRLTQAERVEIRRLRKRPPNVDVHRRVQAVHFSSQRLRVQQIAEIVCRNDEQASLEHHHEILQNAEDVMQALELPNRVVNVCTGDLGQGQIQKFDIETWMPSRNSYGETHSASRFHEFQARRLKLRYRDANRKVRYCHTLNNTVIASPRILIPLLELNQNPDGSVTIPKALGKYMAGQGSSSGIGLTCRHRWTSCRAATLSASKMAAAACQVPRGLAAGCPRSAPGWCCR